MDPSVQAFLQKILETPSPSGYESPLQKVVRDYSSPFADDVSTDVHGNVMAVRNPDAPLRVWQELRELCRQRKVTGWRQVVGRTRRYD